MFTDINYPANVMLDQSITVGFLWKWSDKSSEIEQHTVFINVTLSVNIKTLISAALIMPFGWQQPQQIVLTVKGQVYYRRLQKILTYNSIMTKVLKVLESWTVETLTLFWLQWLYHRIFTWRDSALNESWAEETDLASTHTVNNFKVIILL